VGSSPECDLIVAQSFVSKKHCRLSLHGDRYVLEDLGSTNGTYVNGHRLDPRAPVYISSADQVTLGLNHPMPWPAMPSAPPVSASAPSSSAVCSSSPALLIGRAPECQIRLDYPMISRHHARITREGQGKEKEWIIEDLNSANGVALNQIDNKVQRAPLQPTDEIYLGSYKISASRILTEKHLAQGEGAFEAVGFKSDRMVIGRDPSCSYPLNYPMISWHHAALERTALGINVEDLGSRNGTYVDGERVTSKTLVRPGQEIGLGSFRFQLLADGGLAKREYNGNVTIEVSAIAVNAPNGDRLLNEVSLTVFPSELVALMGPAGAGKTTFLKAINGYTPPAAGRVLFNGADLYRFYDLFRQQMSYVPQDDIVHPQLTVREALYFRAKLRTDLTDPEIDKRIDEVLNSLEIQDKKNTIIGSPEHKVLSGGQRKRVNIAMELIAAAPVIFLDEPTSGLSSYDAENVIKVLKKLSTQGNTIITTIHQPSLDIFKQFDSLIMISRDRGGSGALAYFGPAHPDSIEFFDPASSRATAGKPEKELSPEMLLSGLAKKQTADWVSAYDKSRYKKLFVSDRSGKVPSQPSQATKSPVRKFGFGQWWTLVRRNILLKARDRAQGVILLVQAPLLAVLLGLVFKSLKFFDANDFVQRSMPHAVGIEFLMVVAAVWFGCNNVARDIVGEWTVFQRERMVSLKLPSYVFSKFAVAAVLSLFQCLVLLGIVMVMCHLQSDFLSTLGVLSLASLVGSAVGLCVSARASTTEAAIAMLPLVLLPAIVLGGGLTPIDEMSNPMQQIAKVAPTRWAFEANLLLEAKKSHAQSIGDGDNPEKHGCDLAEMQFPKKEPHCTLPNLRDSGYRRTSLRGSFAVMGGMLVFWLATALIFLRMRDIQ
jgi:ABC-type multidrug transport system ATPase subunit